jgi:hypothetical protein
MLSVLGRDEDTEKLDQRRRLIEPELGWESISDLRSAVCPDNLAGATQMHFAKCVHGRSLLASRDDVPGLRSPGTVSDVHEGMPASLANLKQRPLKELLRDPALFAKHERLYADIFEQLAPAIEGPIVYPGRKRKGRLVFGDATE